MKRRFSSVRTRLALGNMAAVAFILLGFATPLHSLVHTVLMATVDRDLAREADLPFPPASNPMLLTDLAEEGTEGERAKAKGESAIPNTQHPIPEYRNTRTQEYPNTHLPDVLYLRHSERQRFVGVGVLDPTGKRLPYPSGPHVGIWTHAIEIKSAWDSRMFAQALQGKQSYATLRRDGQTLRVFYKPIMRNGKVVAIVQAAYPLHELRLLLHGLDVALVVLIPLALCATGVSGAYLTNRALRPVRKIAQAAAEVEASDLSRRLPVQGNDEFADLATTFNGTFARLEVAFSQLEESVELQRRFAADASHELRTPLTTIKAHTSWALRREREPEAYREALATVDAAAGRMNRLIEDLLRLARADSGQLSLERRPLPAAEVLQNAVEAAAVRPADVPLCVEATAPELRVCGDPHHLERLFVNLLENAYRHTPSGRIIRLSAHREGNSVVFCVADTGEGIPPEHLPFVCQRFYRVDTARARVEGGTGLGLAICLSIAQAHGGTLDIASEPGRGTTVTVTLPAE